MEPIALGHVRAAKTLDIDPRGFPFWNVPAANGFILSLPNKTWALGLSGPWPKENLAAAQSNSWVFRSLLVPEFMPKERMEKVEKHPRVPVSRNSPVWLFSSRSAMPSQLCWPQGAFGLTSKPWKSGIWMCIETSTAWCLHLEAQWGLTTGIS